MVVIISEQVRGSHFHSGGLKQAKSLWRPASGDRRQRLRKRSLLIGDIHDMYSLVLSGHA